MGMQINQLTATTPTSGQNVPVYDPANGDTRRWSLSDLLTFLQAELAFGDGRPEPNTQYAAPSATAFTVAITDSDEDVHLILTPTAAFNQGTIILPSATAVRDKQIVIVNCTQLINALSIDANGAVAVTGAPTSMGADDYFTLKYDAAVSTWYRIG